MSKELTALLEECARQRTAMKMAWDVDRAALREALALLGLARNLHALPWKERVSIQDQIDQVLGA